MRLWEVEDNKAAPSNLVREQDFILRIRRAHRLDLQLVVVNLALSAADPAYQGRGPMEEVQQRLQTFAESSGGTFYEMSCGDAFLSWPDSPTARSYPDQVMKIFLPEGYTQDDIVRFRFTFHLPADYAPLRERANFYVEASRTAAVQEQASGAAQALQGEFVRGPLTAWTVYQIEKLLSDISIRRHIRRQAIYEATDNDQWVAGIEECFIALNELHTSYFPKIDISTPNHLFLAMCQALDRRLITGLTRNYEMIKGQRLTLNLMVTSVTEAAFTHFSRMLPVAEHGLVGFELNAGDLFQDMELTLNAIQTIKHEGFHPALDGVVPDMLPYINFDLFDVDMIKINVGKDRDNRLNEAPILKAFDRIPREKIVFYHCDSRAALDLGKRLGVKRFQGWLVDDLARDGDTPLEA